jgi:CheY-like chemotaxis protein
MGTILTILVCFYSPEGGFDWVVVTDRIMAISAIWITTAVLWIGWPERAMNPFQEANESTPFSIKRPGIQFVGAEKPDLNILNINLPGISGIEVLERLQGYESTKDILVIALSTAATKRDIEKSMETGFLKYLIKPINVQEVAKRLKVT